MSDGADRGVSAERALGTILGNEPHPTEEDERTPAQMRVYLLACGGPGDYGETSRWTGRQILEAFIEDPELVECPIEAQYDWDAIKADPRWLTHEGVTVMGEHVTHPGLMPVLKERGVEFEAGLTGFMWGWAANAARYCVGAPAAPNPALVEVAE